jgi:hypothetical protein
MIMFLITSAIALLFPEKEAKSVCSASQKTMGYPTLGEADQGDLGACPTGQLVHMNRNKHMYPLFRRSSCPAPMLVVTARFPFPSIPLDRGFDVA